MCERYRNTDLLEPQMGWWAPRMARYFDDSTVARLTGRDGKTWQVYGADRTKLSEGSLETKLPLLRGGPTEVTFTCSDPDKAQVKLTKVYR